MSKDVLVECEVFEGMFSDEAVVEVADQSFIVPKAKVRVEPNQKRGRVKARLIRDEEQEWIVMPTVYSDLVPRSKATIVNE